jgi:uncharacterized SAM-binding protein YcdF (DUF218 family)
MECVIRNAVALLLMPPGLLILAGFFGLALTGRHPRLGKAVIALALALLYALSTPYVADGLLGELTPEARNPLADHRGQAIVVLGGGKYYAAPEYGGDTVRAATLVRLRYAARLNRLLGTPILVAGGSPEGGAPAEAWLMKYVLQRAFGVPVRWVEDRSDTTLESARAVHTILESAGVRTIYLVTHAWHMPRARLAFEHAGFTVIPAPTRYATHYRLTALDFLPRAVALLDSSHFFHEILGLAWYRLKFRLAASASAPRSR